MFQLFKKNFICIAIACMLLRNSSLEVHLKMYLLDITQFSLACYIS